MTIETLPSEVSDVDLAFPARGVELAPAMDAIPAEYRDGSGAFSGFASHWFLHGLSADAQFGIKDGVDPATAFRHLKVVIGCYGLKHEHKEAAVDYLASLWFEAIADGDKRWGDLDD